jgi:hypothetical protein
VRSIAAARSLLFARYLKMSVFFKHVLYCVNSLAHSDNFQSHNNHMRSDNLQSHKSYAIGPAIVSFRIRRDVINAPMA